MAYSASSKKRARTQAKRGDMNASFRSMVRTFIKKVRAQIIAKDSVKAQEAYAAAQPIIDKMVNKGIYSKNKAARTKSRLVAAIKAIAA